MLVWIIIIIIIVINKLYSTQIIIDTVVIKYSKIDQVLRVSRFLKKTDINKNGVAD